MFNNEMLKTRKIEMDNKPINRWIDRVNDLSLQPPRGIEKIIKSAEQARAVNCPLPLIISLCPAIKNLEFLNNNGQTRELVVLEANNPRLEKFAAEFFNFNKLCLENLGVPVETLMIFADVLENDARKMFTNVDKWPEITSLSAKNISKMFSELDRQRPGEFQRTKFKIPKIRLQSNVLMQAGKAGLKHNDELRKVELACLDPNTHVFDLFFKHLKLTANTPFVATGFQTIKSAEAVWNRVRFMLAQCAADGIVLPKIMKEIVQNSPDPIFVCSTIRPGGIELEMDAFGLNNNPSMAVFKNIGSWTKDC